MSLPNAIYCHHGPKAFTLQKTRGPLLGCTLAVKDVFSVHGHSNSAGNPQWYETHPPALETAESVERLMQAGCTFQGFTVTDELAYSLEGNNIHYGVADNPTAPGYHCGGSSMGSVAAVAGHWADIGLGTDTGGSIRVPASYCGVYGMRPSHGAVSTQGVIGLAPSFDTVGWFCREPSLLKTVGDVLLPPATDKPAITELLVWRPLLKRVEAPLQAWLEAQLEHCAAFFDRVITLDTELDETLVNELADTFRVLQGRDIAREHAEWLTTVNPVMSESIRARFKMALALTETEEALARKKQQQWQAFLQRQLLPHQALFLPTTPSSAPKIGQDQSALRQRLLTLTSMAGLSGACQIHIPAGTVLENQQIKKPYGYSLMAAPHQDHSLLDRVVNVLTTPYSTESMKMPFKPSLGEDH